MRSSLIGIFLGACVLSSFGAEEQAPPACGVRIRGFRQVVVLPGDVRILLQAADACAPKAGLPFELYAVDVEIRRKDAPTLKYTSETGFLSFRGDSFFLRSTDPVWMDLNQRQIRTASGSEPL